MNYRDLIKNSFWLTLRNRYLWFFGFFAGGTSAGGSFNVPSGGSGGFDMTTSGSRVKAISVAHQTPRRASTPVSGYSITSF